MQNFDFRMKASGKILKMYSKLNDKKLAGNLNRIKGVQESEQEKGEQRVQVRK